MRLGAPRRAIVRLCLLVVLGAVAVYLLYALEVVRPETWGVLPDTAWAGRVGLLGLVLAGAALPLTLARRAAQ